MACRFWHVGDKPRHSGPDFVLARGVTRTRLQDDKLELSNSLSDVGLVIHSSVEQSKVKKTLFKSVTWMLRKPTASQHGQATIGKVQPA